jgi:iron(III) transport system permease protein
VGSGAARAARTVRLGRWRRPALTLLVALSAVALGLPLLTLLYWVLHGGSTSFPVVSLLSAAGSSLELSLGAALLTTLLALPASILVVRRPSRVATALERTAYLPYALPGIVIALALIVVSVHYFPRLYGTTPLLLIAYSILSLPLALVAVRAALAQAPARQEELARSLGCGPLRALWRVTLPRILPGLGAAAALVFLATITELTATLLLAPIGTQTLATQFWADATTRSFGAAAPYAGLMVAISAPPTYLLTRSVR